MNRPQLPKYVSRSEYTVELEKYCDELESKLKGLTGDYEARADILHETKQELERYKKALDKACKFINDVHSCPLDTFDFEVEGGCDIICSERTDNSSLCWKVWALKDD